LPFIVTDIQNNRYWIESIESNRNRNRIASLLLLIFVQFCYCVWFDTRSLII